jgi:tetratricopeptide (TPR) repeat protein
MPKVVGMSTQPRRIALAAALSILAVAVAALALWRIGALRAMIGTSTHADVAHAKVNWVEAEYAAREILKLHPDDPAALRTLARAAVRLGRDDRALALYGRHIARGTLDAEDYTLLGLALERQKRPEEAAQAWESAMKSDQIPPPVLEELTRNLIQYHRREESARAAERLASVPGWEARGEMMLGTIRAGLGDVAGADESFRRALAHDAKELDNSSDPVGLGKLIARTFLRVGRAAEARARLQAILSRKTEPESWWLLSRAYLQEGDGARAREALARSGSYRADHPLEAEPSPYVGESRCESCHARIFRDSLSSRHTRSYYRGDQLKDLPRPAQPQPDPDDPKVTHALRLSEGSLRAETRVGSRVFEAVIEYAFGTSNRYLTMVGRDASGGYRIARLSYYDTAEGRGWDRSSLDKMRPVHPEDFQGEAIGVRDGLAKCLYCHVTNPRSGREATGPEVSDRAIGCERCHGPGGNHLSAVAAGFPEMAMANPATALPQLVTTKQCNDCHILGRGFHEDDLNDLAWVRSQGVGWTYSRCNTESRGTSGCVTCHDPHKPASSTTTAQYEAKCLSCHSPTGHGQGGIEARPENPPIPTVELRSCPVNPSTGCLGCHMERVYIPSLHLSLTDHYIRIRSKAAPGGDGGHVKSVR